MEQTMDPTVRVAALALLAGCNATGEPFSAPDRQGPDWAAGAGAYSGSWVRQITPLATPVNAAFTQGAGTLVTGTYYYRVVAKKANGTTTLASTETSLAITGPAGVNVAWGAVSGATGYDIYGRTTGAEQLLASVGAVTTWLDNGSLTPSGALPAANTTGLNGCWLPCSPGAQFYFEAQAKRTSGTGSGGRLNVGFYPTFGSFTGGTVTSGAYSTSGSWAKVTVTSAAAPAGTNAAYISYEAASGDVVQFDALLARRVMQPETIDSQSFTPTGGTGWTVTFNAARRVGPFVHGRFAGNANTGAFTSILTMPAGSYPALGAIIYGTFTPGGGLTYPAEFYINTSGVVSMNKRHDGTSFVAPPAPNSTDNVAFDYLFVMR